MKLIQSFGILPSKLGGGVWLEVKATDLGTTPDMVLRSTISQEAMMHGMPIDRAIYDLRRKLEVAIGDELFKGIIP